MKKVYIALAVVVGLVLVALGSWWLATSSEKTDKNSHTGENSRTDEQRYQKLLGECKRDYQQASKQGRRYFRYPCQPHDIKIKFQHIYGHEYTGPI